MNAIIVIFGHIKRNSDIGETNKRFTRPKKSTLIRVYSVPIIATS